MWDARQAVFPAEVDSCTHPSLRHGYVPYDRAQHTADNDTMFPLYKQSLLTVLYEILGTTCQGIDRGNVAEGDSRSCSVVVHLCPRDDGSQNEHR